MKKIAIIWRKSVYDTKRCPGCSMRLITDDWGPVFVREQRLWDGSRRLVCAGCGLYVAELKPYIGDGQPGAPGGRWEGKL